MEHSAGNDESRLRLKQRLNKGQRGHARHELVDLIDPISHTNLREIIMWMTKS